MFALSDQTLRALLAWSLQQPGPHGPHVTRYSMYRALRGQLAAQDGPDKVTLSISHSLDLGRGVLGLVRSRYVEANYPQANILALDFAEASFDACVSDQVLEHVEGDPVAAFRETARILRPGGFLCHTTCFINEVHGVPRDFWRFTPQALALMAEQSGCRTVLAGGWGNTEAWALIQAGLRFAPIPDDPAHPLHAVATRNDPAWPIVVWIIAQKL